MAKKSEVTKEFSIGKNTYLVGEVKSFSDELTAKHSDCLKKSSKKLTVKTPKEEE